MGLAKDSKYQTPLEAPMPFFYAPFRQRFAPGLNFSVTLRTAGDPMRLTPILRREALALNQAALFNTSRLSDAVTSSLYPQKVVPWLMGAVGLACLLLAAVGLFSVMSYAVTQRIREVGIRMALGARPADVCGMVVRQGIRLTLPGLLAGVAISIAAARLVSGMLVEVRPSDPLTFGAAALFLTVVALAASYIPALRATRVDPMTALRCECGPKPRRPEPGSHAASLGRLTVPFRTPYRVNNRDTRIFRRDRWLSSLVGRVLPRLLAGPVFAWRRINSGLTLRGVSHILPSVLEG